VIVIEEICLCISIVVSFEGFFFNARYNRCYFLQNQNRDIEFCQVLYAENLNYGVHEDSIQVMEARFSFVLEFFALKILVFFVKNKLFNIIFWLVCFDGLAYPLRNLLSLKSHTLSHALLYFV